MSEWTLQWIVASKIIALSVYAMMYGSGGIWHKPTRRIYGSFFLTSALVSYSLILGTFSWWYLLCFPLLWGATSIGYGGTDNTFLKIVKRGYCGAAYACATLPVFIVNNNWTILTLHILICLTFSIVLGVINPFKDARHEESLIGVGIGLMPLMTV